MTQKRRIRIIGVMLVVISALFMNLDVYADDCPDTVKDKLLNDMDEKCKKRDLTAYYDIKLKKLDDNPNTYHVSVGNKDIKGTHKFKIVRILDGTHSYEVKAGQDPSVGVLAPKSDSNSNADLYFSNSKGTNISVQGDSVSIRVKLVSAKGGNYDSCLGVNNSAVTYSDSDPIKKCNFGGEFKVDLSVISLDPDFEDFDISAIYADKVAAKKAEFVNKTTSDSNYKAYEFILNKAKLANHKINNPEDENINLQCEYKDRTKLSTKDNNVEGDPTADSYYPNRSYYYSKEDAKKVKAKFHYEYTSGKTADTEKDICSLECTEALRVEYGPPVASKAGMCFEYKVKVTSYEVCNAKEIEDFPTGKYELCTPSPYCENGLPRYSRQAGPTEEFEACINECDGGKYSRSCSDKCYKKVYGNTNTNLKLFNSIQRVDPSNLTDNNWKYGCAEDDGCYVYEGGVIVWKTKFPATNNPSEYIKRYGRWYREENYTVKQARTPAIYPADDKGIPRAQYIGTNTECNDTCYWQGCSKKSYLNKSQLLRDMENNYSSWEKAVDKCMARAKCATSTAEYTIKTDYTTTKGTKIEVDFPSSAEPVIKHNNPIKGQGLTAQGTDNDESCKTKSNLDAKNEKNNIITDYNGCYKECKQDNWYMTEWSFPGSWINNKTGKIIYKKPGNLIAYQDYSGEFCLPRNAKTVNENWFYWNQVDECRSTSRYYQGTIKDWNITATAKKFGHFLWNITVQCFYAINNEAIDYSKDVTKYCPGTVAPPTTKVSTDPTVSYEFRVINEKDMFPGSKLYSSSGNGNHTEVGYNWTDISAAANSSIKPSDVVKTIQNRTDNTFDDKYRDYYFELDKASLAKIRVFTKTQKNGKYTDWKAGSTNKDNDGIVRFKSELIKSPGSYFVNFDKNDNAATKIYGHIGQ